MDDHYASEWKKAQIAQFIAEARAVVKAPVSGLAQHHRDVFDRALRNVLATELAQTTYAQIIDGFPIVSVAKDARWGHIDHEHPVFANNHDKICPGAWEKMEEFHSSFNVGVLTMDKRLLHAYSAESVGSRAFQLRLIEMVAVAVHELAVLLYNMGDMQQHNDWKTWKPPKRHYQCQPSDPEWQWPELQPYLTLFFHFAFLEHEQYPEGVADIVGYWAENRILGGVVLFDRGESGNQCPEVYFQSGRRDDTHRIYALTDEQKAKLASFFAADTSSLDGTVLPILGDSNNRVRVDSEHAVFGFHVYRDKWERMVVDERDYPRRCVQTILEYPEIDDGNWG
ncbi:hypothetical protein C8A01DRAFT_19160 [Parachaetomium inaequale]|uniref:Uncharacterized protein n=1 Tax=Parachaetomium inaequale TaxID=2588326 RepID=A0AAN6PBX7_9PEZI|nr:hypothetical protein C8A01DRAFT_19160 [Parachaetomium inaequale]